MASGARIGWLAALGLLALSGCAENSLVLQGRVREYQQQQVAMNRQYQELKDRADRLDQANQDLTTRLALAGQQTQLAEEQATALRGQLRAMTDQLTQAQTERQTSEEKSQALSASLHRQTGVTITPNNSFVQTLPVFSQPGVHARRDGDVIRIELPASRLFDPGGAQLRGGAAGLIAEVAAELRRNYPDQIIGVEGHTDSDPLPGGQWRSNHQLSTVRAMAVYEELSSRIGLRPEQLFVVGHGSNHPVVSNATPEGKQRNHRVELVIYPDRWR
jgi:flagellar motor protein MotB